MNLPPPQALPGPAAPLPAPAPLTIHALFADRPRRDEPALASLPPMVRTVATKEVDRAISEALDLSLGDVVARAWKHHRLESGAATVTATLKVNGQVAATKTQQADARHVVPLTRPLLLLDQVTPDPPPGSAPR